jgi:molybdenum cofactor guanylyltransferase
MIVGAVLAGGQSSRFKSDKGVALWRGSTLLEHACSIAALVAKEIIICGRDSSKYPSADDRPRPGLGPLGGLNAALHWGQEHGFDWVFSIGCDTPVVPPALLAELVDQNKPCFLSTLPIIGYWPSILADNLDEFLGRESKHSVHRWAESIGAVAISSAPLPNVNTLHDLIKLK